MRASPSTASVTIYTWSRKVHEATNVLHYVVDVSDYRDPIGQSELRSLRGDDPKVIKFVSQDPRVTALVKSLLSTALAQLGQNYTSQGWCSIGICDTHGRLISPAIAELLAQALEQRSVSVSVTNYALGA